LWCYREPIPGFLFLQKLAFISVFEIHELRPLRDEAKYRAEKYGPFSYELRRVLDTLVGTESVIIADVPSDRYERNLIGLSTKGLSRARELARLVDPETLKGLESRCRGARQLGYAGILRYVYSHYPSYANNSEIRDEVYESFGRFSR
jgi:hypothetical protein